MFRRIKIVLIRGFPREPLSHLLTITPLQRVQLDHVMISLFLRNPHFLPEDTQPEDLLGTALRCDRIMRLIQHLEAMDNRILLASEYGAVVAERGGEIRVVEGCVLKRQWIFDVVKAIHKNQGCNIIEVDVRRDSMIVNGEEMTIDEGLKNLTNQVRSESDLI